MVKEIGLREGGIVVIGHVELHEVEPRAEDQAIL
jgi:hypothetical protein